MPTTIVSFDHLPDEEAYLRGVLPLWDTPLDDDFDYGPTCSICDGAGHGYPGAGPCPLEERGWEEALEAKYQESLVARAAAAAADLRARPSVR